MAVELYLEEEHTDIISDSEKNDEWFKTVEELGLKGQQNISENKKSPVPFLFMKRAMINTYETLCPSKSTVEEFDKGTIPLRVLSMIALAKQQNYFAEIEVWYDDVKPDPIVVGKLKKTKNEYDLYLIARWGDELRSFIELQQQAAKRWIARKKIELEDRIIDTQKNLEKIESHANKFVNGEYVWL